MNVFKIELPADEFHFSIPELDWLLTSRSHFNFFLFKSRQFSPGRCVWVIFVRFIYASSLSVSAQLNHRLQRNCFVILSILSICNAKQFLVSCKVFYWPVSTTITFISTKVLVLISTFSRHRHRFDLFSTNHVSLGHAPYFLRPPSPIIN